MHKVYYLKLSNWTTIKQIRENQYHLLDIMFYNTLKRLTKHCLSFLIHHLGRTNYSTHKAYTIYRELSVWMGVGRLLRDRVLRFRISAYMMYMSNRLSWTAVVSGLKIASCYDGIKIVASVHQWRHDSDKLNDKTKTNKWKIWDFLQTRKTVSLEHFCATTTTPMFPLQLTLS